MFNKIMTKDAADKEVITLSVDKKILAAFLMYVPDVDEAVEKLMYNYVVSKITATPKKLVVNPENEAEMRNAFRAYLTQVARKSTGDHFSSNVANSYTSAVNKFGKIARANFWTKDSDTVAEAFERWRDRSDFKEDSLEVSKTLSNGVKRYIEFLKWKETNA